ncbi:MAG TPA: alpha/beta hydrolase [Pyrinomonadaceae bacterium]|nr:alpha/beta hydrolase [Pyrinomonadaceae bacterium]
MGRIGGMAADSLVLLLLVLSGHQRTSCALAQSIIDPSDQNKIGVAPNTAARFVVAGNSTLHYVDSGKGRPVVMIHGNAGDLKDFDFGAMALLVGNYRVLAFDLPGHGLSKMPRDAKGTIQEQAVTLHQALTALRVSDPILVGHSWGGAIALAYAVLYPHETSALVLLAPAAYPDHRHDAPFRFLLRVPLLNDVCLALFKPIVGRKLLKSGLKEAFSPDPVPDEYLNAVAAVWLDREHLKAFIKHDAMANSSLRKLSPGYAKIKVRVIIVTGDSDLAVPARQNAFDLHRAIAGSRLIIIPHAGHQILAMHPEVVRQAVDMAALDTRAALFQRPWE